MNKHTMKRRELLRLTGVAVGTTVLASCISEGQRTEPSAPSQTPGTAGRYALGKLEGGDVVLDAAQSPKSFKEAPELAEIVRTGNLPPVAERIGQDPLVIRPVHGTGKYGGTLRRGFTGTGDFQNPRRFASGPDSFLYWDHDWKKLVPNIARGFELNGDGRVLTLFLRRGMRWSDGAPFTADDVMFWYEDMYQYRPLIPAPAAVLQSGGKPVTIERVDATTVRFVSTEPYHLLPEVLASSADLGGQAGRGRDGLGGFAPRHYLSTLHPKYIGQVAADKLAADAKFPGWAAFFKSRCDWVLNADLPVLTPWKVRKGFEINNQQSFIIERNPYSIWVDTEGNQLPYISVITHGIAVNAEVLHLRATGGEYDYQSRGLDIAKVPVLLANQDRGGYKINLDPGEGVDFGVRVNLSYDEDAEIGDLLRTPDFRRALSLGIDRAQVNEAFFLGTGIEASYVPSPSNKYFPGDEWTTKWATLDIAKANQLLDGLGLKMGADGIRQRRDGKGRLRLDYTSPTPSFADWAAMGEMIRGHWQKIGIELTVQGVSGSLALERALANQMQLSGQQIGSEDLFLSPEMAFPSTLAYAGLNGILYAQWFQSNGTRGKEPYRELRDLMDLWRKGFAATEAERVRIGKEWWQRAADQCLQIGVVSRSLSQYGIHLAKNGLGNVPGRTLSSTIIGTPLNALPMTFYWK